MPRRRRYSIPASWGRRNRRRAVNLMKFKILLVMLFAVLPAGVSAGSGTAEAEIDHLLNYIGASGCVFERNGEEYGSGEARAHIQKKYDYFEDKIDSAEKFIELCATKSIITGVPYRIRCQGKPPVESRQWLLDELRRFRAERGTLPLSAPPSQ